MIWWRWIAALLLFLVLQSSLSGILEVFGVIPDISALVVISAGLTNGIVAGSIMGFLYGILTASIGAGFAGVNALIGLSIGVMAGAAHMKLLPESLLTWISSSMSIVFLSHLLAVLLLKAKGMEIPVGWWIAHDAFPSALYTSAFSPILFPLIRAIGGRKEEV
jgi:rod shape-determining protein MreD